MARKNDDEAADDRTPAQLIDARIAELPAWEGKLLADVRAVILAAEPDIEETWKWRGVPVWEKHGIICTGESYQQYVKLTFAKGASLPDPTGLFNADDRGNTRRAINLREGAQVDAPALTALVRAAIALNLARRTK